MEKQPQPKNIIKTTYSYTDLLLLENNTMFSSFGKNINSNKNNAPQFSFGTANRDNRQKMFTSDQIAEIDFKGIYGNGPASYYNQQKIDKTTQKHRIQQKVIQKANLKDKFQYNQNPKPAIGKQKRFKNRKKFNYFEIQENYFKPNQADNFRRVKSATPHFGVDPRNNTSTLKAPLDPNITQHLMLNSKMQSNFLLDSEDLQKDKILWYKLEELLLQSVLLHIFRQGQKHLTKYKLLRFLQQAVQRKGQVTQLEKVQKCPEDVLITVLQQHMNKTIREHYDFEYDDGRKRDDVVKPHLSSKNPVLKNRMLSNTFGKATKEQNRGFFKNAMSTQQMKIRIEHPKY